MSYAKESRVIVSINNAYDALQSRKNIGECFREMYGCEDAIEVEGVDENLLIVHDFYPVGWMGVHLIIFSQDDVVSMARLNKSKLSEVVRSIDILSRKIELQYEGEVVIFEHGAGDVDECAVGCGGCHVDHAHFHLLLLPPGITLTDLKTVTTSYLERIKWFSQNSSEENIRNSSKLCEFVGKMPYLLIGRGGNQDMELVVYRQDSLSVELESQLMRKIIATLSGHSENSWWHWRDIVDMNIVPKRASELSGQITQLKCILT